MKKSLKDLVNLIGGYAFKSELYQNSGIRVIRIANVQDGYISDESPCFYPLSYKDEIGQALLHENELLMSLTGNVGRVALLTKELLPAGLNQRVACLRTNNSLLKRYLYFYFRSNKFIDDATQNSSGIAQLNMSTKWLGDYQITLYDDNKMFKICTELETINKIIQMKRQKLDKFDELIKSRFIEMFGNLENNSCNFKMDKMGNVCKIGSSHRVFTTEFVNNGIPFYRGTEIGELSEGREPSNPYYISNEHYERIANDETKPKIGDILIPSICNKAQVWMVNTENPFYYKDGRVLSISPDRNLFNCKYFESYFKFKSLIEYPKLGAGSTFAEFKIFILKDMDIIIPPIILQNEFAEFVELIDKSKFSVQKEIELYQELLDKKMEEYFG